MNDPLDWNVAVYCLNEAGRLRGCLDSIVRALGSRRYVITALFNGTTDGGVEIAREAARRLAGQPGASIEIFRIATPDKANAINRFFHELRRPARLYAGIDGYVHIGAGSFTAMEQRLAEAPHALAMSGSAITGRSMRRFTAETLAQGGRLHGQFHALRPGFVEGVVARGIRLPIGLYFGDGLMNSMAAHNLDPMGTQWDNLRSQGASGAEYALPVLSPFSTSDIRRHFRRKVRQHRGRIQSQAIKEIIYQAGYEALPADANVMERDYIARHGLPPVGLADRLFQWLAVRQINQEAARADPDFTPHPVEIGA